MLVLVRHGETDWNAAGRLQGRTDVALNRTGRLQAHEAGAVLAADPWDLLVASPLGRAVETARIIGSQLGLELDRTVPGLVERGYGQAEGRTMAGLSGAEHDALLLTAEPEAAVVARALPALQELAAGDRDRRIVVVAHGTLIRLVMGELLGRAFPSVRNGQTVLLEPALLGGPLRPLEPVL